MWLFLDYDGDRFVQTDPSCGLSDPEAQARLKALQGC